QAALLADHFKANTRDRRVNDPKRLEQDVIALSRDLLPDEQEADVIALAVCLRSVVRSRGNAERDRSWLWDVVERGNGFAGRMCRREEKIALPDSGRLPPVTPPRAEGSRSIVGRRRIRACRGYDPCDMRCDLPECVHIPLAISVRELGNIYRVVP